MGGGTAEAVINLSSRRGDSRRWIALAAPTLYRAPRSPADGHYAPVGPGPRAVGVRRAEGDRGPGRRPADPAPRRSAGRADARVPREARLPRHAPVHAGRPADDVPGPPLDVPAVL